MKRNKISNLLLGVILFIGVSLLLYPSISNFYNSFHQTQVIARYDEEVTKLDGKEISEALSSARKYNEELYETGTVFKLPDNLKNRYEKELNISGLGVMGAIDIPKIKCKLPIYHGSDEASLQAGLGHIDWSSLPVGGKNTHTVLAGHRGMPSAKLLTNLNKLKIGDKFTLHMLKKSLVYKVDQIKVVEPDKVTDLEIIKGKDLCTLVTCTPYGIGTHRLLVRGHRVLENQESAIEETADNSLDYLIKIIAIIGIAFVIVILLILRKKYKKKRKY